MIDIWFISDTHFWHTNCWSKFKKEDGTPLRNFTSTVEMNEHMIEKWNGVVKPRDHIWHLGDVTMRYDGSFNNIMSRLNGHKRLTVGNHDKMQNPNLFRWFEKVEIWRGFKEYNFTASHFPLRLENLRDGDYCVHGHVHANTLDDERYINVSVEAIDYTPVHIDTIREKTK